MDNNKMDNNKMENNKMENNKMENTNSPCSTLEYPNAGTWRKVEVR